MITRTVTKEYAYIKNSYGSICIGQISELYFDMYDICKIYNNRTTDQYIIKELQSDNEWKYLLSLKDKETILGFRGDTIRVGKNFNIDENYILFNDTNSKQLVLNLSSDKAFVDKYVLLYV